MGLNSKVIGIDRNYLINDRDNIKFIKKDLDVDSLDDFYNKFDGIVSFETIEHLDNIDLFLKNLFKGVIIMKKKIIIIVLLIITIGVISFFVIKSKDDLNNNNSGSVDSNNIIDKDNSKNKEVNKKELYLYSSADSNAMQGNPELLYIYEISSNKIDFKYSAIWNSGDIEGIATSTDGKKYIYEYDNKEIEILLDSIEKDSIKVTEYENGNDISTVNLFK